MPHATGILLLSTVCLFAYNSFKWVISSKFGNVDDSITNCVFTDAFIICAFNSWIWLLTTISPFLFL